MRIRYGKKENGALIKKAVVYTRDEHRIDPANVDRDAAFIVSRLKAAGFETYVVGGAVRDLMLGKKPKDFDIVTGATPAKIKRVFRNSRIIGRRFRLVHVFFGPRIFEVSTFRSLKDGHTSNTYGTIEEDVLRRDFSINALFYDPEKQEVVDYVDGMSDIRRRRIRPIIPAELIFTDDPVRMIRAVKYAAATGFEIPWLLKLRIKKEAPLLDAVSPSRRTEELLKIVHSPYASQIAERLENSGLWVYLQAGASAMLKADAGFRRRYFQSLAALGEANAGTEDPGEGRRLAALVRDYLESQCPWDEFEKNAAAARPSHPSHSARPGAKTAAREDYKTAFFAARRFTAPVNPPRAELEKAVRLVFAEHGFEVKKIRLLEERRPRSSVTPARPSPAGREDPGAALPSAAKPKRRRARRRKPKSGGGGRE